MATSRQILRAHGFKNVTRVVDASKRVQIEVTKGDVSTSARKSHRGCAMAVACKRKLQLDGVIMSRSIAYLIKDKVATRYAVPATLAREVVSFDRSGIFEAGSYHLSRPEHGLNHPQTPGPHSQKAGNGREGMRHITANIRASLGSERSRRSA